MFLSAVLVGILASTITDVGLVILMILVGLSAYRISRSAKTLNATLPGMKFEIGQINKAVNHVKPGDPTLIEQVGELRHWKDRFTHEVRDRLDAVEYRVKIVDNKLANLHTQEIPLTPVIIVPADHEEPIVDLDVK